MSEKKSFVLYLNYKHQFDLLSLEQRGRLISAIFEYCESGSIITPLDPLCDMAFSMIQDTLDRDAEKYEAICARNAENGRLGGRPKKVKDGIFCEEKPKITERFLEKPKKADNDNDNENENENVNDSDNGSGSGNDNDTDNACYAFASTPTPQTLRKNF